MAAIFSRILYERWRCLGTLGAATTAILCTQKPGNEKRAEKRAVKSLAKQIIILFFDWLIYQFSLSLYDWVILTILFAILKLQHSSAWAYFMGGRIFPSLPVHELSQLFHMC
uniref:AlNc14C2G218 protein n=1 Tax=Albugo laibachii Nc14 TaxID=890382 RepID=F0VZN5_9STRA|nr:AlNc14C2G218 [Albugo laibachii Nc14]|eukprot:CCA14107.1 AlNc14C2G218 [Albugo laibachii Nc14]